MNYLFFYFFGFINTPFYKDWSFWLSVLSLFLVMWTIYQTIQLRKDSQLQNKLIRQPYLGFEHNENNPANYIIANRSLNTAFNIFVLFKDGAGYKLLQPGAVMGVMSSGQRNEIFKGQYLDLDKDGVLKNVKSIKRLIDYLERKNQNYQCIVYNDLFGNKLYSVFYVSSENLEYDNFSETGYIENLK